ncbi:hypothetical protein LINGRAHAP2_LOCUS22867 [Linum grandiflorum]
MFSGKVVLVLVRQKSSDSSRSNDGEESLKKLLCSTYINKLLGIRDITR